MFLPQISGIGNNPNRPDVRPYENVPTDEDNSDNDLGRPGMNITVNPSVDLGRMRSHSSNSNDDVASTSGANDRSLRRDVKFSKGEFSSPSSSQTPERFSGGLPSRNLSSIVQLKGFSASEFQYVLEKTLDTLYHAARPLKCFEARHLIMLLQQRGDLLLKTLTAVANLAAFTVNQDLLRTEGCLDILVNLLGDRSQLTESVRVMLLQSLANMAVNISNLQLLKAQRVLPLLIDSLQTTSSELQKLTSFRALLNLTIEISKDDVEALIELIPILFHRLFYTAIDANLLLVFGILVNMSCCSDLLSNLFSTEIPNNFGRFLDVRMASNDILLRSVTFICNVSSAAATMGSDDVADMFDKDSWQKNSASPPFTLRKFLYDQSCRDKLSILLFALQRHSNVEVSEKALRIIKTLRIF